MTVSLLVKDSSFPFRHRASMLVAIATTHSFNTYSSQARGTRHEARGTRHEARGTRCEAYSDQSSYCLYSIVLFFSCSFVLLHSYSSGPRTPPSSSFHSIIIDAFKVTFISVLEAETYIDRLRAGGQSKVISFACSKIVNKFRGKADRKRLQKSTPGKLKHT